MHNALLQIFSRMGQTVLERSRGYYYPHSVNTAANLADTAEISAVEYAAMLLEIDRFGAQLLCAQTTQIDQMSGQ